MEKFILSAKKRDIVGKKVKALRIKGIIPANLYGSDAKPENLSIDLGEFQNIYSEAGTSSLVDLKIDDNPAIKILLHEPQMDPVKDIALHADLYKVNMKEKITTEIPLEFIGESLAVKDLEGNLITTKDAVEVECLPNDLISEIKVDISALKTFDDMIYVKNLVVPSTVKILDDPEEMVSQVTPPRSEEELEAMEQEAAADQEKEQIDKIVTEADAEKAAKESEKGIEGAADEAPAKETPVKEEEKK